MKSLQEIYKKYSMNDCGGDKGTMHSYIETYEEIFNSKSISDISILEIGVYEGHSLMMWSEFFENSKIYGIDINIDKIKFTFPTNVTLIHSDINSPTLHKTELFNAEFDYIIDDGSHNLSDQIKSYHLLWPKLKKGGVYIIEDIQNIDQDKQKFLELSNNVKIHDLRHHKNRYDDVLISIYK